MAVRCTARQPKSTTFSGCPTAQLASVSPGPWPVSVDAAAYPLDRCGESGVANRTGEPAVTDTQEPAVPPFGGQPHFEGDMESGVGRSTPCTRHIAGSCTVLAGPNSGGMMKGPAGWAVAAIISASAGALLRRLAQSAGVAASAAGDE